jgi:hypothetical protein
LIYFATDACDAIKSKPLQTHFEAQRGNAPLKEIRIAADYVDAR